MELARKLTIITLLLNSSVACSRGREPQPVTRVEDPLIFGQDDRRETVFSPIPGIAAFGANSAALIPTSTLDLGDPAQVGLLAPTLTQAFGVCADEAFASQPIAANCSATLIASDLILTAGHCINPATCAGTAIVFGYAVDTSGALSPLDSTEIFSCTEVVSRVQQSTVDYAIVRLDRAALGRAPAHVRLGDLALAVAEPLFFVGYPSGLPQKAAGGARVTNPRSASRDFFTANLDAFPGSSGGGVFDATSGDLVGLVARGPDATYAPSPGEGCSRAVHVPDGSPTQIESTYVARAITDYCGSHQDPTLCSCGNGSCEPARQETTATCPVDCGSACGDGACNGPETAQSCYADCGSCGNSRCEAHEVAHQSCCEDCGCPNGYACSAGSCAPRLGNVNADATLDQEDASALRRVLREPRAGERRRPQADVDCNGTLNAQDAALLDQRLSGALANLPCETPTQLALGLRHSCALVNGRVRCWGDNSVGQLGTSNRPLNASAASSVPVALPKLVVQLATANDHTCALDELGAVRCWGSNQAGQLGLPAQSSERFPPVALGEAALQVRTGVGHSCALLASHRARCWGDNSFGQLGAGPAGIGDDGLGPIVELPDLVREMTLGASHTCALLNNGDVRCWGANQFGQLGLGQRGNVGDDELPDSVPAVELGEVALGIRANWQQTCAILQSGGVRCWGDNAFGELGYPPGLPIGDNEKPSSLPVVPLGGPIRELALGQTRTCGLFQDGSVRCWGLSLNGQLGYGSVPPPPPPLGVPPSALPAVDLGGAVSQLSSGMQHACVVLVGGALECWGANQLGQLGFAHRSNIGDDETPRTAGAVPLNADTDLGWSFVNPRSLEVWQASGFDEDDGSTIRLFVANRGQETVSDFRVVYALNGAERPGAPISLRSELTPDSHASLQAQKAPDLWSLIFDFAGTSVRPGRVSSLGFLVGERVRVGYPRHVSGWDPNNDYSASERHPPLVWHLATRVQLLVSDESVWYGWSRPADP